LYEITQTQKIEPDLPRPSAPIAEWIGLVGTEQTH